MKNKKSIKVLLSVLAALTFTYSCSGENITMTFPKLLYIGLIVAKCVFDVSLIRKGIACVKEPMKVLMNEDALNGLKYKWKYAPDKANKGIMISAIVLMVLSVFDFLVVGVLATVFLNLTVVMLAVLMVVYAAIIALEIVTMCIKDYEIYDSKGNLIV